MKPIKTRPGLSSPWVWFFTFLPATFMLWLPYGTISNSILIVSIIVSLTLVYPIVTLLPRPHIFTVLDETSILTSSGSVKNNEVTLIELVDCGRLSGWFVNLYTKWGNTPTVSIPIDRIDEYEKITTMLPKRLPTATFQTKILMWGKVQEWLVIVLITLFSVGLIRFVINMFFV